MRRGEFRTPESRRDAGSDLLTLCEDEIRDFGGGDARFSLDVRHASSHRQTVRNDIIARLRDERATRWALGFCRSFW